MKYGKQEVLKFLKDKGITFRVAEHPAAFTVKDVELLPLAEQGKMVKNLFLRDAKGHRHFLVVVPDHKPIDLKALKDKIGSTRLSFGSPERLDRFLGVSRGSVSPFGILNDETATVEVFLDKSLQGRPDVGVHPNDNTATVFLACDDLEAILREHGNTVTYLDV